MGEMLTQNRSNDGLSEYGEIIGSKKFVKRSTFLQLTIRPFL
jgi:hypothetical protein